MLHVIRKRQLFFIAKKNPFINPLKTEKIRPLKVEKPKNFFKKFIVSNFPV